MTNLVTTFMAMVVRQSRSSTPPETIAVLFNAMVGNEKNFLLGDSVYYYGGNHNDSLDADVGPNSYQNTIVLAPPTRIIDKLNLKGTIKGVPGTILRLDLYAAVPDSIGARRALDTLVDQMDLERHLTSFQVTVDGEGNASVDTSITDIEVIEGLTRRPGRFPGILVTNQDLETSQIGITNLGNPVADMVAQYSDSSKYDGNGGVVSELLVYNKLSGVVMNVVATDTVPTSFTVDSTSSTVGSVETIGNVVTLTIPQLALGDTARLYVAGRESQTGDHIRHAHVTSALADPDDSNNRDTLVIDVPIVNSVSEVTDEEMFVGGRQTCDRGTW